MLIELFKNQMRFQHCFFKDVSYCGMGESWCIKQVGAHKMEIRLNPSQNVRSVNTKASPGAILKNTQK